MRNVCLSLFGAMLISLVVGCGGSTDNTITTPDTVPPPPTKDSIKNTTSTSPDADKSEEKIR